MKSLNETEADRLIGIPTNAAAPASPTLGRFSATALAIFVSLEVHWEAILDMWAARSKEHILKEKHLPTPLKYTLRE